MLESTTNGMINFFRFTHILALIWGCKGGRCRKKFRFEQTFSINKQYRTFQSYSFIIPLKNRNSPIFWGCSSTQKKKTGQSVKKFIWLEMKKN